jgi:hypothetical protein
MARHHRPRSVGCRGGGPVGAVRAQRAAAAEPASAIAVLGRQFVSPLIAILLITFAITLVQGH